MNEFSQQTVIVTTRNTISLTLGIIAVVVGVLSLLVGWIPLLGVLAIPVATIGLVLAALGFLISMFKEFSGAAMPLLGVFICGGGIAMPIWMTTNLAKAMKTTAESMKHPGIERPDSEPVGVGSERIEGAFGKNLGDAFNTASAIETDKLTDGTPMYRFTPENPFRSFNKYYVLITPNSGLIYSIWGQGSMQNTETAKIEQTVVAEILTRKYGESEKPRLFDHSGSVNIHQGNRRIITKISGFTEVQIEIRYHDADLEKLAARERIDDETSKANKTGL